MAAATPIRVVCAAASPQGLATLAAAVAEPGGPTVVGTARTAADLVREVGRAGPDVVAVDLDLPGRRGGRPGVLEAVEELMRRRALAILVLSGSEHEDGSLAVQALAAGAVDVLPRPCPDDGPAVATRLRRRVGVLSRLPMVTRRAGTPAAARTAPSPPGAVGPVVAIASSTGGPGALLELLGGLGAVPAPVLLVQHIHADFTGSFARWLQAESGLPAALALAGRPPEPGRVTVAPPDVHLRLGRDGRLVLDPEPAALLARPSGDELLASVAAAAGPRALGAVLTGMGEDGARGLLAIREAGGATWAQDAESAVVDGMPGAARRLGAAQRSAPPRDIGVAVAAHLRTLGVAA